MKLGDLIHYITTYTGIKWLVYKYHNYWGTDCGCDKRQEELNKLLPYKKPKCLEEWEFNFLHDWYKRNTNIMTRKNQIEFLKIYNRVFGTRKKISSCSTCVKEIVLDLKKVYNKYL